MCSNIVYKVGQVIPFGKYIQKESSEYQPIEWQILNIQDGMALLLSKECLIMSAFCDLEYAQYNMRYMEWEHSRARAVLNGAFYYYAFSKEDKTVIRKKQIIEQPCDGIYKQDEDFVFLLTEEEVEKYIPDPMERRARPTERAKKDGAAVGHGEHEGYAFWWIMPKKETVGTTINWTGTEYKGHVWCQFVAADGSINWHGRNSYHKDASFRPAVWIDLQEYAKFYEKMDVQDSVSSKVKPSSSATSNAHDITKYYENGAGGIFKINRKNRSAYILNKEEQKWIPNHVLFTEFEWGSIGAKEVRLLGIEDHKEIKADPKEEKMVDITIGRAPSCGICLESAFVSRVHASLHYLGGKKNRWVIVDEHSTHGIFVNDERVLQADLQKGDEIKIGDCQIVFCKYDLEPGSLEISCGAKKTTLMLPWKEILDQGLQKKKHSRYLGCFVGGAVGDALGYPVEFMNENWIYEKYGKAGIQTLEQAGHPALISDDTQMHLFAANAVICNKTGHYGVAMGNLLRVYQEWLGTQGDFCCLNPKEKKKMWLMDEKRLYALRAPGNTCLNAIRQTEGKSGVTYAENNSKGCGTVMRAAVFGLSSHYDPDTAYGDDMKAIYTYAKYDAKLTHGHPMAVDSSVALALMIYEMVQRNPLRSQSLQDTIKNILQSDSELNILLRKAVSLALNPEVSDLDGIHVLGEGWIAEEALAIALFCAVRYQNDFAKAIRVSVNHKGDSDSTGAICGYILGAWIGEEAVEQAFELENLELRDVIEEIAEDLYYAVEVNKGKLIPVGLNAEWDAKYRR